MLNQLSNTREFIEDNLPLNNTLSQINQKNLSVTNLAKTSSSISLSPTAELNSKSRSNKYGIANDTNLSFRLSKGSHVEEHMNRQLQPSNTNERSQ